VTRFLLRRLIFTLPALFGVATLVFSLIHLVPGDPAHAILGESAAPEHVIELRQRLGLDRPIPVQYVAFFKGIVVGDLGTSLRTREPIVKPRRGCRLRSSWHSPRLEWRS